LAREARQNNSSLTIDGTVKTLEPSRPLRIPRDLRVEITSLSVEFFLRWHGRAWHV
jgi:hypothetical protein